MNLSPKKHLSPGWKTEAQTNASLDVNGGDAIGISRGGSNPPLESRQRLDTAILPDAPQARQFLLDRVAAEIAPAAISAALAEYPDLGANGFGPIGVGDFDRAQIATALLFFLGCGKVSPKRGDSSYTLKHQIERWGRRVGLEPYCANGCCIAAATALGFPMHRYTDSPNPWIGVRAKDVERLTKSPRWWS